MDLSLILTEDCNLRCTYCYQKNFRPTSMPTQVGIAAVRKALEYQEADDTLSLTFFGGEPLLQADRLLEILRAARTMERKTGRAITAKVPTNGLLLDEAFLDKSEDLGLFVSLSFDGIQPAQDAGRISLYGLGSFERAERALSLLLERGKPFGVYSVITPDNVAYLVPSRRYLWERGVRILVSAIDYTADWDGAALETLADQYLHLGEFYEEALGYRGYSHVEPFDSRIALRTRTREVQNCCPGIRSVTVAPDGTLYGCVEYFYRRMMDLGTIDTWLDAEKVQRLAKTRSGKAEECRDCGVRDRCTHTCDCVNLRTTGEPNQPALSLCLTEQSTIQSVDRIASKLFAKRVPGFLTRHYSDSYSLLSAIENLLVDMEASHESATC